MIQSVQRAAQILAVLGSGTPRLGVTEIADRVGLAKPTVHGLLRTLEAHDLVAQDPDTGKYSLGPGVLQLGNAYLDGSELRARSLRWAESLAQRAGEAVWVATLSGTRVIVLHHVFRPDNTVQILEVGAAIPWHACALGHAIVAFLPEAQRARALAGDLAPLTGRTKTTRTALNRALAQVRGSAATRSRTRRRPWATPGSRRRSSARDGVVAGAIGVVGAADRLLDRGHPRRAGPRGRRGGPGRSPGTWARDAAAWCCPRSELDGPSTALTWTMVHRPRSPLSWPGARRGLPRWRSAASPCRWRRSSARPAARAPRRR